MGNKERMIALDETVYVTKTNLKFLFMALVCFWLEINSSAFNHSCNHHGSLFFRQKTLS